MGEVSQHSEYIAFGETFVEEHKNSHNSPYKFNGKELDEESGLYYYGARYYDPRVSLWNATDPLSGYNPIFEDEHYIDGEHNGGVTNSFNHATYGYCYQNPIRHVDPNGKQNISSIIPVYPGGRSKSSTPILTGSSARELNSVAFFIPALRSVALVLTLSSPIELIQEVNVSRGREGAVSGLVFFSKKIAVNINLSNSVAITREGILAATLEDRKNNTIVGSYTINFSNGKKYHGKGNFDRAVKSALRYSVFGTESDATLVVPKSILIEPKVLVTEMFIRMSILECNKIKSI